MVTIRSACNNNYHELQVRLQNQRNSCRAAKPIWKAAQSVIRKNLPGGEFHTHSLWFWGNGINIRLYYTARQIPSLVTHLLEKLERFGLVIDKWVSKQENGSIIYSTEIERQYKGQSYFVTLDLCIAPDEEASEATCRRVIVGEDTRVTHTPRYEVRCY